MTTDNHTATGQVWSPDAEQLMLELAHSAVPAYSDVTAKLTLLNLSENATFRVDWDGDTPSTVLRVHRAAYSSPQEIDSELAWMRALREDAGIQTPETLKTRAGQERGEVVSARSGETHSHVMFRLCPGTEPSTENMEDSLVRLGEINAVMHEHAKNWRRPAGFTRRTWDFETTLGARPHWGRWRDAVTMSESEQGLLSSAVKRISGALADYGATPDRFGLVHADLRLANLLVDGDTTYVIDFDDCGFGWYLYDAATALTFLEDRDEAPSWLQAWVSGYERRTSLSAEDRAVLPSLLMLRRMLVLAWLGSHAETELAREESHAYLAATCALASDYLNGAISWV